VWTQAAAGVMPFGVLTRCQERLVTVTTDVTNSNLGVGLVAVAGTWSERQLHEVLQCE